MDFLYALLLSLLPPFYRRTLERHAGSYLVRGALVTALFEIVLSSILYAKGFIEYTAAAYIPQAAVLEYFFTWKGLCFSFFFVDGAVRLLATVARQALGLFPLYLVAWTHAALSRYNARKKQPALIADLVEGPTDSGELKISSCRPRKNWDKWMTVMHEEKLYEIAGAELADSQRPYVYLLRPKPESKVIRGLHRYHPDEVFHLDKE